MPVKKKKIYTKTNSKGKKSTANSKSTKAKAKKKKTEEKEKKIKVTVYKSSKKPIKDDLISSHIIPIKKKVIEAKKGPSESIEKTDNYLSPDFQRRRDYPEGKKKIIFWTAVILTSFIVFVGWYYMFKNVVSLDIEQKSISFNEDETFQKISEEFQVTMESITQRYNQMKETREKLVNQASDEEKKVEAVENFTNKVTEDKLIINIPIVKDLTSLVSEEWDHEIKSKDFSDFDRMNLNVDPTFIINLESIKECECDEAECPEKSQYSLYFYDSEEKIAIEKQIFENEKSTIYLLCRAPEELFLNGNFIAYSFCNELLDCNDQHEKLEELLLNNYHNL